MIIEIIGKFYDNHSLSIINRNLATKLYDKGIRVKIAAIDSYDPEYKVSKKTITTLKKIEEDSLLYEGVAPDIQLRHTYPPMWNWPLDEKTKVVYIQPWEFPKAPFEWQYKFETFADALIVPSNQNSKVFADGGLNPNKLFVVPNGYDEEVFNTEPKDPLPEMDKDKFNFVYVGNSQWRKGLEILLNVWHKTFKSYDNARLIIKDSPKIYGPNNVLNEIVRMQYTTGCAPITYISRDLSDKEMASLYSNSKVLLHPYRAEGFAMHVQEAAASGCFPVVPIGGPTDDFIPNDTGMKIGVNRQAVDITDPNIFALKPGDAATMMSTHTFINEPSPIDLENAMRTLYHTHDKDSLISRVKDIDTLNNWDSVIDKYIMVFEDINSRSTVRSNSKGE